MDYVTQIIDPPPSRNRLLLDGLLALRKPTLEGVPSLPKERLVRSAVPLSANEMAAYGRACGFRSPPVLALPCRVAARAR